MACQVLQIDANYSFVRFNSAALLARFGAKDLIVPLLLQALGRKI